MNPSLKERCRLFISLSMLAAILLPNLLLAQTKIVTTIKPLQLIAQDIVQGQGEVSVIVGPNQSAHQFSISPSDRLAVASAEIILWIGPEFEQQLSSLIQQQDVVVLSAMELDGIELHSLAEDSHAPGSQDAHLWLNTSNAMIIAKAINAAAIEIDPANTVSFQRNLDDFEASIVAFRAQFLSVLPTSSSSYIVYHNAFQYFEKEFGIAHQFALLRDPEVQPSMQQIMATRERMKELRPGCLLLEPDANMALVQTLLDGAPITIESIDPLGNDLKAGARSYLGLLENIANAFSTCQAASDI